MKKAESASTPIGLEGGDSKSLGGNHSACRFESDLAHSALFEQLHNGVVVL